MSVTIVSLCGWDTSLIWKDTKRSKIKIFLNIFHKLFFKFYRGNKEKRKIVMLLDEKLLNSHWVENLML